VRGCVQEKKSDHLGAVFTSTAGVARSGQNYTRRLPGPFQDAFSRYPGSKKKKRSTRAAGEIRG
jgi:hypothetical protein